MRRRATRPNGSTGFTIVELLLACVIFPIVVIGVSNAYLALRKAYITSRQMNEIYSVLSACPELDRALDFNSLTSTNNCYPNNVFSAEDGSGTPVTYTPSLTVTNTTSLPGSDPLEDIPDSKVVDISVGFPPPNQNATKLELRMLVTRNGIGQQ